MAKTRKVSRSSKTGEFVKPQFAKAHPATTQNERIPVKSPKKK